VYCIGLDTVSFSDEVWFTVNGCITSQNNRLGFVKLPVYCLTFTSSSGAMCYAQNHRTSVSEREERGTFSSVVPFLRELREEKECTATSRREISQSTQKFSQ
jgi:hypothetical protein